MAQSTSETFFPYKAFEETYSKIDTYLHIYKKRRPKKLDLLVNLVDMRKGESKNVDCHPVRV